MSDLNEDVIKIPTVEISGARPVYLWLMSDVHYGHRKCDVEYFKTFIDWISHGKNRYVLGLGDYIESAFPSTSNGKMMWDQIIEPREQIQDMAKMLQPIRKRILGLVGGNHEKRSKKLVSIDSTELISQLIDVPYLLYTGWVRVKVGDIYYVIHYHHGSGSSSTVEYSLKKLENSGWHGADIRAIGHAHNIGWIPRAHYIVDTENSVLRRHVTHEVRTGSFLREPMYALEAMYNVAAIGSPILRLNNIRKDVQVFMSIGNNLDLIK